MAVSKLRFKADDGNEFPEWEEMRLNDIATFHSGLTYTPDDVTNDANAGVLVLRSTNIQNGLLCYEDNVYVKKDLNDDLYVKLNDIVVCVRNGSKALIGKNALVKKQDIPATWGAFMIVIRAKSNYHFVHQYLNSELFKKEMYKDSGTATINQITMGMLNECRLSVPSLPEQKKIAAFLSTIDEIITTTESELIAWQERKKGVIQKIFNREVRFKADDGSEFPEWEEKTFADVFENMNNNTFSRDCLNYSSGFAKNIHYGDILVKFNSYVDVMNDEIPYINKELSYTKYSCLQDGDIVIADTAEDETVGKAVEIENANNMAVVAGLHTIACRPKMKFAKRYLGYYLNSDTYHMQLRPYMQGIKVTSISKSNISLTKIILPSLPEQKKIADCLSSLDDVINQIQAELSAWKEFKKGLLQQMFV